MNLHSIFSAINGSRFSKWLISSYIFDWICILIPGALGRIFKTVEPNKHAFYLRDPNISYPHVSETVPPVVLILVSLLAPAAIIALGSLLFIPGRTAEKHAPSALVWRRKLWEWNAGWMGLGVAYAGTYAATEGLKTMFGKPRPDMLARCKPDVDDIATYIIGGLAESLRDAPALVSWKICTAEGKALRDGFVSFPSGHASMSFAGLTYLTLWLCAKLSISFPYLHPRTFSTDRRQTAFVTGTTHPTIDDPYTGPQSDPSSSSTSLLPLRDQNAAPPAYLLLLAAFPICTATYIASSRWWDNRHFGFDILFGSALGIFFAYLGFRLYHLPLGAGAGWAWGARSRDKAFYAGVGLASYATVMDGSLSSSGAAAASGRYSSGPPHNNKTNGLVVSRAGNDAGPADEWAHDRPSSSRGVAEV
ncbi:hypothetical protein AJ80_00872 [Polytolypa hystricis UAMH7299]|uniref:Phosphatidic acid phosphatase type 2/haloperoxidase domain-containing protein n=1 Tax=Polytolypa hystricis (strain UAMH7299) TaxID=1447883 RepID=A0A2B7YTM7_POLH7|nr:hypothetical protein AJ80_00872 [Polytolypa hystricis UAMH7299]